MCTWDGFFWARRSFISSGVSERKQPTNDRLAGSRYWKDPARHQEHHKGLTWIPSSDDGQHLPKRWLTFCRIGLASTRAQCIGAQWSVADYCPPPMVPLGVTSTPAPLLSLCLIPLLNSLSDPHFKLLRGKSSWPFLLPFPVWCVGIIFRPGMLEGCLCDSQILSFLNESLLTQKFYFSKHISASDFNSL